jgi:heme exporter protein A
MLETTALACERGGLRLFSEIAFSLGAGGLLRLRGPNGEEFGRELAYVGHAPALKAELTVAENLAFALAFAGHPASGAQMEAALQRLGIARLAALPARFLSQGQKRRASLARLALAGAPPLWLLDEPFAALDDDGIACVRALAASHLAAGGMVVLTSHQEVPLAAASSASIELGA